MRPETFASLVSAILYEKRFVLCEISVFVEELGYYVNWLDLMR